MIVIDELSRLLAINGFLPHGYCISWSKPLVLTFVISDLVIFLSYFSMPVALGYFAQQRRDFPYRWLLWLFAAFIMACGTTHLMGAIVLWQPMYNLEALLKAFTALVSLVTAIVLWPLIPHALKLPSPSQLARANEDLQHEIVMRKQVEEELRLAKHLLEDSLQSERIQMAAIVESSEDAIIGKTLDGVITSWNRGAENIFGYPAAEMVGQSIVALIPSERRSEEAMVMATILRGESLKHFDTQRLCKDGRKIDVSVTVSPIRDNAGRIVGASKIARDISEQKRAEAALAESRQLLETIIDTAPVRVFWKDRNLRYLGCNPAFAMDAGKSHPCEVVGKDDYEMGWADRAELYRGDDREVIETGMTKAFYEEPLTTPDGQTAWIRTAKVPLRNRHNETIGMLGLYEDITERKRAQAELDQYRLHLETLVQQRTADLQQANSRLLDTQFAMESVGIGIEWVDAQTGRFIYVNKSAARALGYTQDEMLGLSVSDIDPNHPTEQFRQSAEVIRREGYAQFESLHRTKDGRITPVEVTVYFVPAKADSSEKFISFVTDITKRKETELLLIQAKKAAEAANLAKSAFLANMSHEIRTPMNGILGMANILRREGVTPKQAERLDTINTSAQHLLAIINSILDLSKIDAGKFVLEEAPVALGSLLTNVTSILAERAREKGIRLLIETESLPHNLLGDPTRLQQALLNYASNAVKFTEKGTVKLHICKLAETPESALMRFEVQDTGIGIPAAVLPRLFSAFEQADNSTTRKYGGTGLGLAITCRLAKLMGGEAGVESEPGMGSTFWFTARLKKGGEGSLAPLASNDDAESMIRQNHSGKRILVVDDDPMNREVAQIQVEAAGLAVDVAEDGAEAVALVEKTAYAAIFMDMQMPNIDGLEATRMIRKFPDRMHTPIIAMTANAFAEDKARCMEAGMNDFLIKPFDPDTLFSTLLRALMRVG